MDAEAGIQALERRVVDLEAEMQHNRPKLDHVLNAIVDMHDDVRRLEKRLPDIIARAVAPLIQELKDN